MVPLETDATLREIVARLVRAVDPDKLVLFGSRAAGRGRLDSDYDVLIVKAESDPRQRRTGPLYRHLWGIPGAVDLLWFTPEEIDEWSQVRQHVATRALRDGVVVYEKRIG
ncbi:MAG: nucleotidyltransferase domain-containing protein [Acidobacteria bacterium]|nr:nucleotidyltransferase domain-containing protein [Acidobacteriota bacterium]